MIEYKTGFAIGKQASSTFFKKLDVMKTQFHFWLMLAFIFFYACHSEEQDWKNAQEKNTKPEFEQFIKRYPHSPHIEDAKKILFEIEKDADWKSARSANTVSAFCPYFSKYRNSPITETERDAINKVLDVSATKDGSNEWRNSIIMIDSIVPFDTFNIDPIILNKLAYKFLEEDLRYLRQALYFLNLASVEGKDYYIEDFVTCYQYKYGSFCHDNIIRAKKRPSGPYAPGASTAVPIELVLEKNRKTVMNWIESFPTPRGPIRY